MTTNDDVAAVILAAGIGKRMKSDLAKVLHLALGRPLVEHVLDAVHAAGIERIVVVIGHQADRVREALAGRPVECAEQLEQLGTGHAVQQAAPLLQSHRGDVVVLCGDTPLLTGETLRRLCEVHRTTGAAATVLTAEMQDPTGYGRVIRAEDGGVLRIVEHEDATDEERRVREINSGLYVFAAPALFEAVAKVDADNAQGEYYLTDTLEILRRAGRRVSAYRCPDPRQVLGVNDPDQLREAERHLAQRVGNE
ncbi:MAG: NTP transferase domain-containing protein [Candidatus Krumholzibacteriia bacterium]